MEDNHQNQEDINLHLHEEDNEDKNNTTKSIENFNEEDALPLFENDEIKNTFGSSKNNNNTSNYVGKKPKWWKVRARRKGTKGQRNAINIMAQRGYVIPKLDKYLHVINVQKLVQLLPRGQPLTSDEIFIPRNEYDEIIEQNGDLQFGDGASNINDFDKKVVHLEIGFGQGENLLTNAMMNPDQFYIGAEIHSPGAGMALNRMKHCVSNGSHTCDEIQFWREQEWFVGNDNNSRGGDEVVTDPDHSNSTVDHDINDQIQAIMKEMDQHSIKPYDNLRIYPGDGVKILRFLPSSSIDNIYLTFPDPWPKSGSSKYRVIQEETVNLIFEVLKPRGCFYLATDSVIFDEWTKEIFSSVQKKSIDNTGMSCWEEVIPCFPRSAWLPVLSKYEKKGVEEGRHTIVRCWRSIARDL